MLILLINFCHKFYDTPYQNDYHFVPGKDPLKFRGIASQVSSAGGYTILEIKGDEKTFRLLHSNPYYGKLYEFLEKGDSVYKNSHNDTITVVKEGKEIKFCR